MHLQSVRGTQCCCVHLLRWCPTCSYHSITSTCDSVFFLHKLSLPCRTWHRKEVEDVLLTCYMTFGENLNESLRCVDLVVYLMYIFFCFSHTFMILSTQHWPLYDDPQSILVIHWWSYGLTSSDQFKIRARFIRNNTQIVFLWILSNFHWLWN